MPKDKTDLVHTDLRGEQKMKPFVLAMSLLVAVMVWTTNAVASVMSVGAGAFSASDLLVTFTGIPAGTEVNGLAVDGLTFSYSLGNGQVITDGGPGVTNNISPPNIVSIGSNAGALTIMLPFAADLFGYGYAILNTTFIASATTMSIFDGVTPAGTLSYDGNLDPTFSGGFAGLVSTRPFDRVVVTFNAAVAPAFALDNIRVSAAAVVPEPASILLVLGGLLGVLWGRPWKTSTR